MDDLFKSNVDISINISDLKQGKQLLHQSWDETFIEKYYNNKRYSKCLKSLE